MSPIFIKNDKTHKVQSKIFIKKNFLFLPVFVLALSAYQNNRTEIPTEKKLHSPTAIAVDSNMTTEIDSTFIPITDRNISL